MEEELDVNYYSSSKSPYIGEMASTKISAIGMVDEITTRKSPFWDNDNIFEI